MLAYARHEEALTDSGARWRHIKPGLDLALEAGAKAWEEAGHNATEATRLYRAALRPFRGVLEPAVFRYDQIDDEGRIFQADNLTSPNPFGSWRSSCRWGALATGAESVGRRGETHPHHRGH
jgi:adenine-specific DNA-methyltransferase